MRLSTCSTCTLEYNCTPVFGISIDPATGTDNYMYSVLVVQVLLLLLLNFYPLPVVVANFQFYSLLLRTTTSTLVFFPS